MQKIEEIVQVPINKLRPANYNPRHWSKDAISQLTESIKAFGLVDPILVNGAHSRRNIVIGGHFRLKVAKELGFREVPVVFLNIPEEDKEKELNLRLNKNQGDWDCEMLKDFDLGFLENVGFDANELDDIWSDLLEVEEDEFKTIEELKKINKPFVKQGEMYKLGEHRLLCGDSREIKDVTRLLAGEQIQMLYCDPPYNINLDYNKGIGTKGKYGGTKVEDNKTDEKYKEFLRPTLENVMKLQRQDFHVFYWCDESYIGLFQDLYRELGITNKRVCLWVKNNQMVTPNVAFNKVYEPCVYGVKGSPSLNPKFNGFNELMNKGFGVGNQLHEDIQDLFNIWLERRLPSVDYKHPTEKPTTLHEKAIKRCSTLGGVVLDLFGGSGSTLIACEQMKRRCLMMELDPVFCSLIIRRYEALTGNKAIKITQKQ